MLNRLRDVDIVSNAYPIIRRLVEAYLRVDQGFHGSNGSASAENMNKLHETITELKHEIERLQKERRPGYETQQIVSLLLDYDHIGRYLNMGKITPGTIV